MPLSAPGQKLLSSLRKQKALAAQKRHADFVQDARRRAFATGNHAATWPFLLEAHASSMLEFGRAVLSSYTEAFAADRAVPGDSDAQDILKEVVQTLGIRESVARDEFGRIRAGTGMQMTSADSALLRAHSAALEELRDELDVWRNRRELEGHTAPLSAQAVTISGSNNQLIVAGGNINTPIQASAKASCGHVAESESPLSTEAAGLLRAAARDGEILVVHTNEGKWIRAGTEIFQDNGDPAVAAIYLDALEFLVSMRLARFDSGHLFVLTGEGFAKARALLG